MDRFGTAAQPTVQVHAHLFGALYALRIEMPLSFLSKRGKFEWGTICGVFEHRPLGPTPKVTGTKLYNRHPGMSKEKVKKLSPLTRP
jgi:hypothetical protein